MDHQHTEKIDGATAMESRAAWMKPQVDRFIAGGAEAGGSTSTDGIDILS